MQVVKTENQYHVIKTGKGILASGTRTEIVNYLVTYKRSLEAK